MVQCVVGFLCSTPLSIIIIFLGPCGSTSQDRVPNNSYKPITNTAWVRARLCKLQKGCTRLAAASDKAYQLLAHGRCLSPSTPASYTTKTGRHNITEILLKVALNTINQIKSNQINNISAISWQSGLLVEKTGVLEEDHRPLSHKVEWSTPQHDRGSNSQLYW